VRRCEIAGCRNEAAEHRRICRTCQDRKWRAKYPEVHLWNNLKKSAKKRGLNFALPRSWFVTWCEMTGFAEMVGRGKGFASIDRIESWRGYEVDNIQILEYGANSAKGQQPPPINSEENDNPF
jgi:hypothetical protein